MSARAPGGWRNLRGVCVVETDRVHGNGRAVSGICCPRDRPRPNCLETRSTRRIMRHDIRDITPARLRMGRGAGEAHLPDRGRAHAVTVAGGRAHWSAVPGTRAVAEGFGGSVSFRRVA